jgi:hypothetical protein
MAGSEIARLLHQFQQEEEAAKRGLEGFSVTSRHDFISARMENMGRCVRALAQILGSEEAAIALVVAEQAKGSGTIPPVPL